MFASLVKINGYKPITPPIPKNFEFRSYGIGVALDGEGLLGRILGRRGPKVYMPRYKVTLHFMVRMLMASSKSSTVVTPT